MCDVTDKVTGELPGVEQKRGRGRPRKAHAMTNAERQAAFRARRKAQQPAEAKSVTKRMTVTEMLSDVDAYDECRLEVEELRDELARLKGEYERMRGDLVLAHDRVEAARREMELCQVERSKAFAQNRQLKEQLVEAQKSVTLGNEKGPTADEWLALLCLSMKGKSQITRLNVFSHPACKAVFSKAHQLSDPQFDALQDAILGKEAVTRARRNGNSV